jgi:hypothetical protein
MSFEWVVLLALGAAVLIPAVLLLGFAGCYSPPTPDTPMILSVRGASLTSIEVDWTRAGPYTGWVVEVTRPGDAPFELPSPETSLVVPDLETGVLYRFRVKTVATGLEDSPYSPPVDGTTLSQAFNFPFDPPFVSDTPGAEGLCLILRIEAAQVLKSGPRVSLTLLGPSAGTTSIDRIYISQPLGTGDLYDAAGDLTAVFDIAGGSPPLVLQPGEVRTLPIVDYNLDQTQPLLVAFDISNSPPAAASTVRTLTVQPQDAGSFTRRIVEAAVPDRTTGYSPDGRIFILTRIDA